MRPCPHERWESSRPGEPFAAKTCTACWLWHNRPDAPAVRAWKGLPPLSKTEAAVCPALGADTGERVGCTTCRGKVELKVLACSVHGKCTVAKKVPGIACCEGCEHKPHAGPWQTRKDVAADHQRRAKEYAAALPPYPAGRYAGRGVVICGGGAYLPSVYVAVRMLRHVGCELPVQVWHLGPAEYDARYADLLGPLGVEFVDALAHPEAAGTRGLTGFPDKERGGVHPPFQVKSFAALHSPFREVLLLDADCYPAADPTPLFSDPTYRAFGAVFWPDQSFTNQWTRWADWGVEKFGPECGLETGQYLIDKAAAWEPLALARWYDDRGDWCYGWGRHHGHGDKDTWRVAFAQLRRRFGMYATAVTLREFAYVQVGPGGSSLFVHRCNSKFTLGAGPPTFASTPDQGKAPNRRAGLPGEDTAFGFLDELRAALLRI